MKTSFYNKFFSIIGAAPNCSRCHDCFFQWNDILIDLSTNASLLLTRTQQVLSYYSGYDVKSILDIVGTVESRINITNQTLKSISIHTDLLNHIDTILKEVTLPLNMI